MDLVGSSDSLAAPTETEASVVLPEEKVDKKEDKRDNGLLTDPLNTYLQVQQYEKMLSGSFYMDLKLYET